MKTVHSAAWYSLGYYSSYIACSGASFHPPLRNPESRDNSVPAFAPQAVQNDSHNRQLFPSLFSVPGSTPDTLISHTIPWHAAVHWITDNSYPALFSVLSISLSADQTGK